MMAQMIMKNRKQTVNTGKMFKWDICEKRRKKIMRKLAKWFEEALESYVKLMGNTYGWGGRL